MRLIVRDMITITSVRAAMLRPREVIEVSDAEGKMLLARHPGAFGRAGEELFVQPEGAAKPKRARKAAQQEKKE